MNAKRLAVAIVLLAAVIRFYQINRYPVNIGAFEGIAGYAAIRIAEGDSEAVKTVWTRAQQPLFGSTGTAWNPFLVYPMVGVYRLIGFDLSHIGIRIIPIIYGVLSVWLMYLLMSSMFGKAVGLTSAFLLATASWFITLSRVCNDFSATIFFSLVCFLVYSKSRRNLFTHILLGGLLALGSYFYLPARIVPVIVFVAVILRCVFERGYLKTTWLALILMFISFYAVCKVQGMDGLSFHTDTIHKRANECSWNRDGFPGNVIQYTSIFYRDCFVKWGPAGISELAYERGDAGLDPISRWLVALGLLLSLLRIKDHRYRFLIIWVIGAALPLILTGARAKRGLLVIPAFSALAAVGLCGTVKMVVRCLSGFKNEPGKVGRAIGAIIICCVLLLVGKINLVNYFKKYAKLESRLLARREKWPVWEGALKVLEEKDLYTDCWQGEASRTGEYLARCVGRGNHLYQLPPDEAKDRFWASEGPAVLYLKSGEREEK